MKQEFVEAQGVGCGAGCGEVRSRRRRGRGLKPEGAIEEELDCVGQMFAPVADGGVD